MGPRGLCSPLPADSRARAQLLLRARCSLAPRAELLLEEGLASAGDRAARGEPGGPWPSQAGQCDLQSGKEIHLAGEEPERGLSVTLERAGCAGVRARTLKRAFRPAPQGSSSSRCPWTSQDTPSLWLIGREEWGPEKEPQEGPREDASRLSTDGVRAGGGGVLVCPLPVLHCQKLKSRAQGSGRKMWEQAGAVGGAGGLICRR